MAEKKERIVCSACNGSGQMSVKDPCQQCNGTGLVQSLLGGETSCPRCNGERYIYSTSPCPACNGKGYQEVKVQ